MDRLFCEALLSLPFLSTPYRLYSASICNLSSLAPLEMARFPFKTYKMCTSPTLIAFQCKWSCQWVIPPGLRRICPSTRCSSCFVNHISSIFDICLPGFVRGYFRPHLPLVVTFLTMSPTNPSSSSEIAYVCLPILLFGYSKFHNVYCCIIKNCLFICFTAVASFLARLIFPHYTRSVVWYFHLGQRCMGRVLFAPRSFLFSAVWCGGF